MCHEQSEASSGTCFYAYVASAAVLTDELDDDDVWLVTFCLRIAWGLLCCVVGLLLIALPVLIALKLQARCVRGRGGGSRLALASPT